MLFPNRTGEEEHTIPGEKKVLSFMDNIDRRSDLDREKDELRNSLDGKLRILDREKAAAKNHCIRCIFAKIFKDATPLNDDYKTAYSDELKNSFGDFISDHSGGKSVDLYIREAIKRSPFARRVVEAVDDMINNEYRTKEMNIDNIDPEELVFKSSDDTTRKLDLISQDLNGEDISQRIKDQVRATALSEIRRAKEEKEGLKKLELSMSKDPSITTPTAVETALEMKGITDKRYYTPSLFESVVINKYNNIQKEIKEGSYIDMPLYDTMEMYREWNIPMDASVFTESTATVMLKSAAADGAKKLKAIGTKISSALKSLKNKITGKSPYEGDSKNGLLKTSSGIEISVLTGDHEKMEKIARDFAKLSADYYDKMNKIQDEAYKKIKEKGYDPETFDVSQDPELKKYLQAKVDDVQRMTLMYIKKADQCIIETHKLKSIKETLYHIESANNNIMDHAFVEAVKEYTALSMLKALRLESFTRENVNDIANNYAYNA